MREHRSPLETVLVGREAAAVPASRIPVNRKRHLKSEISSRRLHLCVAELLVPPSLHHRRSWSDGPTLLCGLFCVPRPDWPAWCLVGTFFGKHPSPVLLSGRALDIPMYRSLCP